MGRLSSVSVAEGEGEDVAAAIGRDHRFPTRFALLEDI
jgi:hypothetical protein